MRALENAAGTIRLERIHDQNVDWSPARTPRSAMVAHLPTEQRVAGSSPAEEDYFFGGQLIIQTELNNFFLPSGVAFGFEGLMAEAVWAFEWLCRAFANHRYAGRRALRKSALLRDVFGAGAA